MKRTNMLLAAAVLGGVAFSAQAFTEADIIRQAPDGETVEYMMNSRVLYPSDEFGTGYSAIQDYGFARKVVFCDNGEVYFYNPCGIAGTSGAYMKGTREGNTIKVQLPQAIGMDGNSVVCLYKYKFGSGLMVELDADQTLTYSIDGDNNIYMQGHDATSTSQFRVLGSADEDGNWTCYGDLASVWKVMTDVVPQIPDGLPFEEWGIFHANGYEFLTLGMDDNYVYIQGLFPAVPETVIRGIRSGSRVIFPWNTLLGVHPEKERYIYLTPCYYDYDTETGTEYPVVADEMTFKFNEDCTSMTGDYDWIVNSGSPTDRFNMIDWYVQPVFVKNSSNPEYTTPQPPTALVFMPYGYGSTADDPLNYGAYQFQIHLVDQNYNRLDPANVAYQIFINGDSSAPYSFKSSLYPCLDKDTDTFPYGFIDTTNGDFAAEGDVHTVFYVEDIVESIGVRTVHYAPDGNTYCSAITWNDASGVNGLFAGEASVVKAEYYTLDGRRIQNPEKGLYIKVERLSDGTVRSSKTILK